MNLSTADLSFLDGLNNSQKEAVTHKNGPLLIVAGAGTGKTTVITKRIAHLVLEGLAKTDEILALTFTEKAAGEMEERIDRLLPYGYVDLWVSTFHSFCERILKLHGLEIGLPNNFKLLNTTAQWLLVRKNIQKFDLDYYQPLGNPTKFIHALLAHFSRAKDELIAPEDYLNYAENFRLDEDNAEFLESETKRFTEIATAYHTYNQILLENNSLDFGDLIQYTLKLFSCRPRILNLYQKKFHFILVDEFQDTNWAQYELIKLLAKPKNNLTVCADDDQSIYKFRGASVSNVLTFKRDFPDSKEVFLTDNYRSVQPILDLAYEFIAQNNPNRLEYVLRDQYQGKFSKKLKANYVGSPIIEHLHAKTHYEEAELVAKKILEIIEKNQKKCHPEEHTICHPEERSDEGSSEALPSVAGSFATLRMTQEGNRMTEEENRMTEEENRMTQEENRMTEAENISYGDFAVLVRANSHAQPFIATLAKYRIPFEFYASSGLYSKPIILDVLSFLRLLDDYHESSAVFRFLSIPSFEIPQREILKLVAFANQKQWSLYEALREWRGHITFEKNIEEKFENFLVLLERFTNFTREKKTTEIILQFFDDSGYLSWIKNQDEVRAREDIRYLNEFYKDVQKFEEENVDVSLKIFLEYFEYVLDSGDEGNLSVDPEEGPDVVKIMTIHGAKGLEFPYVFIVNLVDKRFPTIERSDPIELPVELIKEIIPKGDVHLEEERRLMYVAMTRAKQSLFFTSAEDYGGLRKKKLSRFLTELGFGKNGHPEKQTTCHPEEHTTCHPEEHTICHPEERSDEGSSEALTSFARSFATLRMTQEGNRMTQKGNRMTQEGNRMTQNSVFLTPHKFSFTQLRAFETCPLQYKFGFIYKIPRRGSGSASYGRTIHSTLQRFFLLAKEKSESEQQSLFEQKKKTIKELVSEEDILKIYGETWIDDWFEDKTQKEVYRKKGKESLKKFYHALRDDQALPKYLEQGFHLKFGNFTLNGKIDRMDEVEPGNLEIIDYKTGKPKDAKKLSLPDKEQLLIYQMAVRQMFSEKPVRLTFYYLDSGETVSFLGTEKDLARLEEKISVTIAKIYENNFFPKPGKMCKFCDYKNICEYCTF